MPRAAHLGRRSWVGRHRLTDRPSASATACAAEYCTATERCCVVNAMNVRADHVVSSYSDALSLLARHSVRPLAQLLHQRGPKPAEQDQGQRCFLWHELFLGWWSPKVISVVVVHRGYSASCTPVQLARRLYRVRLITESRGD